MPTLRTLALTKARRRAAANLGVPMDPITRAEVEQANRAPAEDPEQAALDAEFEDDDWYSQPSDWSAR